MVARKTESDWVLRDLPRILKELSQESKRKDRNLGDYLQRSWARLTKTYGKTAYVAISKIGGRYREVDHDENLFRLFRRTLFRNVPGGDLDGHSLDIVYPYERRVATA